MADAAVPKSPALAAQQRKRGPTVLERMASEEAAARASKPPPQPRLALRPDGDADACSEVLENNFDAWVTFRAMGFGLLQHVLGAESST